MTRIDSEISRSEQAQSHGVRDLADLRAIQAFLCRLTRGLVECGCSSHRIENLCYQLGTYWQIDLEVLAIPTGVWLRIKHGDEVLVDLIRVKTWSVNLDRLSRINRLVTEIEKAHLPLKEADARLRLELAAPEPYSRTLMMACGAIASASIVSFHHGSLLEAACAFPAGLGVQIILRFSSHKDTRRFLADFIASAFVAAYVSILGRLLPEISSARVLIGGLIVLFPGLTLVNAIHEIAQKNLVSGAARLLEAGMVAIALAFGVGFVLGLAKYFG